MNANYRVVVVGAGSTGAAVAHDLALRGLAVTVVERGEVASGTTGRNHCLLHSGARYCTTDRPSARECIQENRILRAIMPDSMELNGGLFVALTDEDLEYREKFREGCEVSGIPVEWLPGHAVLALEPRVNPDCKGGFRVPDGVFEPLRLCLSFLGTAMSNGAEVRPFTDVDDLAMEGRSVVGVRVNDRIGQRREVLGADVVVNAAGPWAGEIGAMAGMGVPVIPVPGVMVSMSGRMTERVINRLGPPGDGDIIVPQRETSIIGTTSWRVDQADLIPVPEDHAQMMLERGAELIPSLAGSQPRGIFAVARPLVGSEDEGERGLPRTFWCHDHAQDGCPGLVTIAGGKTTTARAMAEETADTVCRVLGIEAPCRTRETPLLSYRSYYGCMK